MAFIDYYKILGVDKTIPQKDVKRAYLKRAKQAAEEKKRTFRWPYGEILVNLHQKKN